MLSICLLWYDIAAAICGMGMHAEHCKKKQNYLYFHYTQYDISIWLSLFVLFGGSKFSVKHLGDKHRPSHKCSFYLIVFCSTGPDVLFKSSIQLFAFYKLPFFFYCRYHWLFAISNFECHENLALGCGGVANKTDDTENFRQIQQQLRRRTNVEWWKFCLHGGSLHWQCMAIEPSNFERRRPNYYIWIHSYNFNLVQETKTEAK